MASEVFFNLPHICITTLLGTVQPNDSINVLWRSRVAFHAAIENLEIGESLERLKLIHMSGTCWHLFGILFLSFRLKLTVLERLMRRAFYYEIHLRLITFEIH